MECIEALNDANATGCSNSERHCNVCKRNRCAWIPFIDCRRLQRNIEYVGHCRTIHTAQLYGCNRGERHLNFAGGQDANLLNNPNADFLILGECVTANDCSNFCRTTPYCDRSGDFSICRIQTARVSPPCFTCDPEAGGYVPLPINSTCDDGMICNGLDYCNGSGNCNIHQKECTSNNNCSFKINS